MSRTSTRLPTMQLVLGEAKHEFRQQARGPLLKILFVIFVAYVWFTMTNARWMADMGASGVVRNGSYLVYLMVAGQTFWLLFANAFVFARPALRDRQVHLHELTLSTPISLTPLLWGRFLGACGAGLVLGATSVVALVAAPLLEAIGWLPPGSVAATPWSHLAFAVVLLVVPAVVGLGALYYALALRTQSLAAPLGASVVLVMVWMFAMTILRGADVGLDMATVIDPTAFGEIEAQANSWAPAEKATRFVAMTTAMIANRVVFGLLPLLGLAVVIARTQRARFLASSSSSRSDKPTLASAMYRALVQRVSSPFVAEVLFHIRVATRGRAFVVGLVFFATFMLAGSAVHIVGHADGPFTMFPSKAALILGEFSYMIVIMLAAAMVGLVARRDQSSEQTEVIDTLRASTGFVRGAQAVAGLGLAAFLTLWVGVMGGVAVVVLGGPAPGGPNGSLIYMATFIPAVVETAAVAFVLHALLRSPGLAYGLSAVVYFIFIINHETNIIEYPPAQFGIPVGPTISDLWGWSPWVPYLVVMSVFKLAASAAVVTLGVIGTSRGTDLRWAHRLTQVADRLRSPQAVVVMGCVIVASACWSVMDARLVDDGNYVSSAAEEREFAQAETKWAGQVGAVSVERHHVDVAVDVAARRVMSTWTLKGVNAANGLHLTLPDSTTVTSATMKGKSLDVDTAFGEAHVQLAGCSDCTVTLKVQTDVVGWPHDDAPLRLHDDGHWLTAQSILPCLGVRPERRLEGRLLRERQDLAAERKAWTAGAACPVAGVARGPSSWTIEVKGLQVSKTTPAKGTSPTSLNFVAVSLKEKPVVTTAGGLELWHGRHRKASLAALVDDVTQVTTCLRNRGVPPPKVHRVLQSPRAVDEAELIDGTLLLPETPSWDIAGTGVGRDRRRVLLGQVLARAALLSQVSVLDEPAARWLTEGAAGWHALECTRSLTSPKAFTTLYSRMAQDVEMALTSASTPVVPVGHVGAGAWPGLYLPLAGHALGLSSTTTFAEMSDVAQKALQDGQTLDTAMKQWNPELANLLLGYPLGSDVGPASDNGEHSLKRTAFENGKWTPVDVPNGRRMVTTSAVDGERWLFDAWPSFERTIEDNLATPSSTKDARQTP